MFSGVGINSKAGLAFGVFYIITINTLIVQINEIHCDISTHALIMH
jgi:hypothetical protein